MSAKPPPTPVDGPGHTTTAPATARPPAAPVDDGPPKWIDKAFIQEALGKEFSPVISLQVQRAVAAGENYATIVYRALVDTTRGPVSLIIKCMPESEFMKKMVLEGQFTEREIRMYERTLPLLRGSLVSPCFPHCYYTIQDGTRDTIVLRDMRPLGFRTRVRQLGMDATHCRMALKELAHLHGLSVALRIQHPEVFKRDISDIYTEAFFKNEKTEFNKAMLQGSMKALAGAVREFLPFRFHGISLLMEQMHLNVLTEMKKCVQYPESKAEFDAKVLVLNHGDFWSNNMLFKYEEGRDDPLECMLIDFQISRCASPVLDLMYFFYSSTEKSLRRAHMDELLELYLRIL